MRRFFIRSNALILSLGVFLSLAGLSLGSAQVALADASTTAAKQSACQGIGGTFDAATGACTTAGPSLNNTLSVAINVFSSVVGVAAVVMVLVGGFKYITSGGDSSKISSAKSTLLYAVIGVVIAVMAQSIVFFVLKKAG
ncbi:MAG TPA: hypothetical protein VLF91_01780 [Candidatus Saccharimonadales bacterium]|nr:hypothetical protein [Candidatus Saccharimonadales bacterium]